MWSTRGSILTTLFAALSPSLVFAACNDGNFDPTADYFPDKVTVDGSSGFTVSYNNSFKVVTNYLYEQSSYILYCTQNQPNITGEGLTFVQIPVTNTAALDPISLSFITQLGSTARDTVHYVGNPQNLTDPCMASRAATGGSIVQIPDGTQVNSSAGYNVAFMNRNFIGGFEFVPNMIPVSLGNDLTPLQKAEWIKFYSMFYNLEATANQIYQQVNTTYNCAKDSMSNVTPRQKIGIVAHDPVPTAYSYAVYGDTYWTTLLSDAGAQSITPNTTYFNTTEDFQTNVTNAFALVDYITPLASGNSSYSTWQQIFGYNVSSEAGFIPARRVFRPDNLHLSNGVLDSDGRAITRPDILLQDIIAMQYPSYNTSYQRTWLENWSKADQTQTLPGASADACTQPTTLTFASCRNDKFVADTSGGENVDNSGEDAPSSNDSGSSKLSKGAVAGVSIGSLLGFGILAGLAIFGFFRWRDVQARKRRAGAINLATRMGASMEQGTRGQWVQFD